MKTETRTIVKPNGLIGLDSKLSCDGIDVILDACNYAASKLSPAKTELTERVVKRCDQVAKLLSLNSPRRLQLELAARVHRVGELLLHENLRDKCFLDMSLQEIRAYHQYPIFSAKRLGDKADNPIHDTLLFHREYFDSRGFLNQLTGNAIPLASRILCAVTEYEELVMYQGQSAVELDSVQRFVIENSAGRYDPKVMQAMARSFVAESISH